MWNKSSVYFWIYCEQRYDFKGVIQNISVSYYMH